MSVGREAALNKLAELVINARDQSRRIVISHCMALEDAEKLMSKITSKRDFDESYIVDMGALTSVYSGIGGICVAL
jgi:fatty acid-binding protein DegV